MSELFPSPRTQWSAAGAAACRTATGRCGCTAASTCRTRWWRRVAAERSGSLADMRCQTQIGRAKDGLPTEFRDRGTRRLRGRCGEVARRHPDGLALGDMRAEARREQQGSRGRWRCRDRDEWKTRQGVREAQQRSSSRCAASGGASSRLPLRTRTVAMVEALPQLPADAARSFPRTRGRASPSAARRRCASCATCATARCCSPRWSTRTSRPCTRRGSASSATRSASRSAAQALKLFALSRRRRAGARRRRGCCRRWWRRPAPRTTRSGRRASRRSVSSPPPMSPRCRGATH